MTRCKPGDLAVIVRSKTGANLGKIVTCIEIVSGITVPNAFNPSIRHPLGEPHVWWRIDKPVSMVSAEGNLVAFQPYIADRCLRPLRNDPGQDETLDWAGIPDKVPEYVRVKKR